MPGQLKLNSDWGLQLMSSRSEINLSSRVNKGHSLKSIPIQTHKERVSARQKVEERQEQTATSVEANIREIRT